MFHWECWPVQICKFLLPCKLHTNILHVFLYWHFICLCTMYCGACKCQSALVYVTWSLPCFQIKICLFENMVRPCDIYQGQLALMLYTITRGELLTDSLLLWSLSTIGCFMTSESELLLLQASVAMKRHWLTSFCSLPAFNGNLWLRKLI